MFREIGSLYSVLRRLDLITSRSRGNCTTILPTWWLSCDDGDVSRKIFILMHLNKHMQISLTHKVQVICSYKPWNFKLNRSLPITVKFRTELLSFSTWAYIENHGVHIVELVCLLAWIAEHGHCIHMNKWFENIPQFKATSFSFKLPFLTANLSRVSGPRCIVFG